MPSQVRCHCRSCTIRSLMGPAVVITIGLLFLLNEVHGGRFGFGETWPVILIVIGLIKLASSLAPSDGHIDTSAPATAPPGVPPAPPAQPPAPENPYGSQGQ